MKPKLSIIFPQFSAEIACYLFITTVIQLERQKSPFSYRPLKVVSNICCSAYIYMIVIIDGIISFHSLRSLPMLKLQVKEHKKYVFEYIKMMSSMFSDD